MALDVLLADRAEKRYDQAREVATGQASSGDMQRDVRKGWIIVKMGHVLADLCNIQTEHPTVSAAGGDCVRSDSNTLIFTFSARAGHP